MVAKTRFTVTFEKGVRVNVHAEGVLLEHDRFKVFAGSKAHGEWNGTPAYRKQYNSLINQGVLSACDLITNTRTFTVDWIFDSPSAAASVVSGRGSSRKRWKVKGTSITMTELEEDEATELIKDSF